MPCNFEVIELLIELVLCSWLINIFIGTIQFGLRVRVSAISDIQVVSIPS